MYKNSVKLSVALNKELFTTVRLTCGGVCALQNFDVDLIEDVKVCVTEGLLLLERKGYTSADITFELGENLTCTIQGVDKENEAEESFEDEISYSLLGALMKNVSFDNDKNGILKQIIFTA